MTAHVEVPGQRVKVEVMMLHSPGRIGRKTVHDQPITAQVGYVRECVVARLRGRVRDDVGEERIGLHVVSSERVLSDQFVSFQVKYHQLGCLQLLGLAPDVVQPSVDQPQPVARVHVNSEHGH